MLAATFVDWIWDRTGKEICCALFAFALDLIAMIPWLRPIAEGLKRRLEKAILLGPWSVKKEGKHYVATWVFRRDGKVAVETSEYTHLGQWCFEDKCLRITWESFIPPDNREHCWETFLRPIKRSGVRGDSWEGAHCVHAAKVSQTT